jgi:hypothetical protein
MAVDRTVVVVGAPRLLEAANPEHATLDCAFTVIIATGTVMAVSFLPCPGPGLIPKDGGGAGTERSSKPPRERAFTRCGSVS